ncbi:hypothetical protein [Paenibacillus silvisoli]|uniref:hypothetical protein n=1 Tax=Paenibacillus silvisoli TaxID=3110539 RepID=UPI0028044A61|nr:hypothetical protein [Paenibacillus silvisoli]
MPPLNKPYARIFRPSVRHFYYGEYIADSIYADDRISLCRSFYLILDDLLKLFEYIEPADENLSTYSHRSYELLLRASTEIETNFKRILQANNYQRTGNRNMSDYYKVNVATKLHEYRVEWHNWRNATKIIVPFSEWVSQTYQPLTWYQSYNNVKHDRHQNFNQASLENVIRAVSALFVLLFSQFGKHIFNRAQATTIDYISDESIGLITSVDAQLTIYCPISWSDNEKYDFDWNTIKTQPNALQLFPF